MLREAAPERPTLDSTLSSDRPFSPPSTEVIDTRPAVPPSLGMGGERPATLTDVTQPTALSEMEKARLATEFTQQQELARAIRDQQDQGIASLNPPSAPAIEATPYDPFIPIEPRIGERSIGVGDTFSRAAEAREQGLDMPDSTRSALSDAMSPASDTFGGDFLGESQARANIANAAKLKELRNTQPNVGTDSRFGDTMGLQEILAGDFDPVSAPSNAKRDFDVMVPTIDRDSSIDQQLLSKALEAKSLPITPTEDFRREFADYGDDISPFDPSDIKSNAQRAVSDLGLTPITRDGEEYFISPAGMVFKQEGDDLVPVAGGEAMQAMDVAQRQGEDFSASPMGMIPIGTRDVDPTTGLVDPNAPLKRPDVDISGMRTPQFLTDALGPGSTVSDFLNVQEGAAPVTKVDETKTRVTPASPAEDVVGFGTQPGYDDYPMPAPITLSEKEAVGVESLRPKARPKGVAPVAGDTTTPAAPDGGGITTVSTKAINDAAKSTGLGVDAWLAIAKGGAAMAASKNPTLLGALGEGAGVAASSLQRQRASDKAASLKQGEIDATLASCTDTSGGCGKE